MYIMGRRRRVLFVCCGEEIYRCMLWGGDVCMYVMCECMLWGGDVCKYVIGWGAMCAEAGGLSVCLTSLRWSVALSMLSEI